MDNRAVNNQLSPRDLQMLQKGQDPFDRETTFNSMPVESDLINSDDMLDAWESGDGSRNSMQDELMQVIAERAAILNNIRQKGIPGGGGDMDYMLRDKMALRNAGFDPNDRISSYLIDTDTSNTNYKDPMNAIFGILSGEY